MQNTLSSITKKQQTILSLIPQYRFLDRTHIQTLLHHKDKKLINTWLKDLVQKQYIERIYENTIVGKNRVPAVYYLATNGIRFLKAHRSLNSQTLQKLYYEKNRSESFISHCLFVATICCQLEQKNTEDLNYSYATESDLANPENPFHFLKESGLSLDLCFRKKQTGKDTQNFLLKLFDETLPKYRIQKQIRDLKEFYFSNEWENNMQAPFPTLLLICSTKQLLISTKRYTKAVFEEQAENLNIHLATAGDVRKESITGQVWESI